jgi:hypothetical protein
MPCCDIKKKWQAALETTKNRFVKYLHSTTFPLCVVFSFHAAFGALQIQYFHLSFPSTALLCSRAQKTLCFLRFELQARLLGWMDNGWEAFLLLYEEVEREEGEFGC